MIIVIEIKNKETRLILRDGQKAVDEVVFLAGENISEKLLPNFDVLLKKRKLTLKDIDSVEVETDLGDTFTSRRIAEAMRNAFLWTKKVKSQKIN